MGLKVIAKERGFYESLREEGAEFEIAKKEDLGSWMEPVGWEPKKKPAGKAGGSAQGKEPDGDGEDLA